MFELFRAGGPLMWVILACSLIALTIIFERLLTLRKAQVVPNGLREQVVELAIKGKVTQDKIEVVREHSPLGSVYAVGLKNIPHGVEAMREAVEEQGKQVVHRLGIGMIKVFTAITANGVGDPTVLSGGISEALITTAAGLSVGIPCLMFYRYFKSRINELTVLLEDNALALIDTQK